MKMVNVTVGGDKKQIDEGVSVTKLLELENVEMPEYVSVSVNEEFVPENSEDNTQITYVALWFCNYFLDLDVHEYMPNEYLLKGFDATMDNPYMVAEMGNRE